MSISTISSILGYALALSSLFTTYLVFRDKFVEKKKTIIDQLTAKEAEAYRKLYEEMKEEQSVRLMQYQEVVNSKSMVISKDEAYIKELEKRLGIIRANETAQL